MWIYIKILFLVINTYLNHYHQHRSIEIMWATYVILNFLIGTLKQVKKKQVKLILITYFV